MRWSYLSLLYLLVCCVSCTTTQSSCQGCSEANRKLKPRVKLTTPNNKEIVVNVELACTPDERQRGLMHRKSLGATNGMLFIFERTDNHSFWMKNTFIPLDMIHIDTNKQVVGIVENAKPHSLDSRRVTKQSKYVLEVNAFFARKHGITSGTSVTFIDIPPC